MSVCVCNACLQDHAVSGVWLGYGLMQLVIMYCRNSPPEAAYDTQLVYVISTPQGGDYPIDLNVFTLAARTLKNGGNVLIPCYPTVSNTL